jgi:glutamine synthetase
VLRTADNHVVFKAAAKELAAKHGRSLTFMAKYDEREGNSCHVHMSLRGTDGGIVFADDSDNGGGDRSRVFSSFVAGVLATLREFTLLYAPNINSYKRYAKGSFAPTGVAWGIDNRTCALRVIGHGSSLRVENRVPGGDVNPYLGIAAIIAGGLLQGPQRAGTGARLHRHRLRGRLRPRPEHAARRAGVRRPNWPKAAFGKDVVAHYLRAADVELEPLRPR